MELFNIYVADNTYRFTSNKDDLVANGTIYTAIPISRAEITRGLDDNGLKITAPLTIPPFNTMLLRTVTTLSRIEVLTFPDLYTLYKGEILKTVLDYDKETIIIYVAQNIIIKNNEFPIRSYSPTCGYNFGDRYCGINKGSCAFNLQSGDFTLDSSGTKINSTILGTKNYLKGGFVVANNKYYSFIMEHNSQQITLLNPLPKPNTITSITVTPTCDKSVEACNYYKNLDHFGGFPYIPDNNIVTGGF